jgi:hypothetical protein
MAVNVAPQSFPVEVASDPAALRALIGAAGQTAVCQYDADAWGLYRWNANPPTDDGVYQIGAWSLVGAVSVGDEPSAYLVLSVAWDGARAAVRAPAGWELFAADATHLYLRRPVALP